MGSLDSANFSTSSLIIAKRVLLRNNLSCPLLCWFFKKSETTLIYYGQPVKKTETVDSKSSDYALSGKDSKSYEVIIEKRGSKFFWKSRNNIEMKKNTSGIYTIYTAENGSGYVKMTQGKDSSYLEHIHQGLNTITYFGKRKR